MRYFADVYLSVNHAVGNSMAENTYIHKLTQSVTMLLCLTDFVAALTSLSLVSCVHVTMLPVFVQGVVQSRVDPVGVLVLLLRLPC